MPTVEIIIDTYLCNGCGSCVEVCPEVFQLDENSGKAIVIIEHPEITDALREAVKYCPEDCIEIS